MFKRQIRTKAERRWSLVQPICGSLSVLQDTKQHMSTAQGTCQNKGATRSQGGMSPTSKPK